MLRVPTAHWLLAMKDGFCAVDDVPEFAPLLQDLQRGTYHTSNGWIPLPLAYLVAPVQLLLLAR